MVGKIKLHLNVSTTKFMLYGSQKRLNISPKMRVMLNGTELEQVQESKHLGLLFDPALTWEKHANVLCHNISKWLGVLCELEVT